MGDAYSSWCTSQSDNPSCPQNPHARATGYLYGIESGAAFTVKGIDLAFHNTSGGNPDARPHQDGRPWVRGLGPIDGARLWPDNGDHPLCSLIRRR